MSSATPHDDRGDALAEGPHRRPPRLLAVRAAFAPHRETAGALTCASTELGEGVIASTNPPAVDVLLAGAAGATFLALVSRS